VAIAGNDHLRQSVQDILTTRVGERILRPEYGSDLPSLIGRPESEELRSEIINATAVAIGRFEPRITLSRVTVVFRDGSAILNLVHAGGTIEDVDL
jgi:phage baseplate assembly protein W